jgi:hypothetical protein
MEEIMSEDRQLSVLDVQRERTILEVLRLMIHQKDENGKNFTISAACLEAGTTYSTWKLWVSEGLVTGPLQQAAQELYQDTYGKIIPFYGRMVEGMIAMAMGQRPPESDITEIRPSDMIAAFREISKIIPTRPLDQVTGGQRSERDHLEEYQPKQLFVVHGDFIYQGEAGTRFGGLPPGDDLEGDYEEVD